MINLFHYLYYSLYLVFKLVKRVGEKDENLASSFYAILLTTNTLTIVLLLKVLVPLNLINQYILKGSFFIVFMIWYLICKFYFLKTGNYLKLINYYDTKFKYKKKQLVVIGMSYILITPILFILIAFWLNKL